MKMFKQYRNWIMKKLEKDRWYIEKDEIKVKGASEQDTYKSGGGFGEDNKDIKAPEVKTVQTADESKNTPEPKIRVMKPKELEKKHKDAGKPLTTEEKKSVKKTDTKKTDTKKTDTKKTDATKKPKKKKNKKSKKKGKGKLKKFFGKIFKKKK